MERRNVSSRSNRAIQGLARGLDRLGITPNQISVASIAAALLVPLGLFALPGAGGLMMAMAGVGLRLLANVLDGLVAVEGGKSTPLGALYNEFPDRVADTVILVALGYSAHWPTLGWACALLAALTAYIRVFGGALGLAQSFRGPMAKQHRMAVVAMALAAELLWQQLLPHTYVALPIPLALLVVATGSGLTCWLRTQGIARQLSGTAQGAPHE
jgi:phosphatidylglycerophosphate synthase